MLLPLRVPLHIYLLSSVLSLKLPEYFGITCPSLTNIKENVIWSFFSRLVAESGSLVPLEFKVIYLFKVPPRHQAAGRRPFGAGPAAYPRGGSVGSTSPHSGYQGYGNQQNKFRLRRPSDSKV